MRIHHITGLVTGFALALGLMAPSAAFAMDAAGPAKSVADGVYTEEQAARGMETFLAKGCNGCHGDAMQGTPGGPAIAGFNFSFKWRNKSLDGLLTFVKENMPPGAAGSLSDNEYTDIIAAIIHGSDYPAGEQELTPEGLASISVPAKK